MLISIDITNHAIVFSGKGEEINFHCTFQVHFVLGMFVMRNMPIMSSFNTNIVFNNGLMHIDASTWEHIIPYANES